jgi:hypothetical protein
VVALMCHDTQYSRPQAFHSPGKPRDLWERSGRDFQTDLRKLRQVAATDQERPTGANVQCGGKIQEFPTFGIRTPNENRNRERYSLMLSPFSHHTFPRHLRLWESTRTLLHTKYQN